MKVYCPYCKKEVNYKVEKREVKEFKGIDIDTFEQVAMCNECNNDLYVNDLENENNKRIYEAYREKTDIIKPQDIIELRDKYSISQRELTAILGFGKMTINRYERGGVPTKSQSDYIKLLIENKNEFIKKTKEAYKQNKITRKTYEKIVSKVQLGAPTRKDVEMLSRKCLEDELFRKPDIYNGYKSFNLEVVENILSYIASKVTNLTITSMNKYLWFIDALSFNQRGIAITGLTYQKQQYGPTIIDKKYQEISMLNNKFERIDYEDKNGSKTIITSNDNFDLSMLNSNEIKIIDSVIKLLKNKKVNEISNMSHKEEGWKNTENFANISFEHTLNLNILK